MHTHKRMSDSYAHIHGESLSLAGGTSSYLVECCYVLLNVPKHSQLAKSVDFKTQQCVTGAEEDQPQKNVYIQLTGFIDVH